jgi:predicted ester cyclase
MATVGERSETAAVAETYFKAIDRHDLDAMIGLWEPGGVGEIHGLVELVAPDSYRAWFANLFAAVPDLRMEILEIVAAGEKAAVRWRATGTFEGTARFEGLAPNDVVAVRDGKLYRNDAYMNGAEMMRQLGALPPAASAAENVLMAALNAKTQILGWIAARRRGPDPRRQ